MSKYPKINYIGNKAKLVDWIIENMPLKHGKILDIFSGGNSVSYALKENNYEVLSNDVLYSNYVISKAIIENNYVKINKDILEKSISSELIEKKYREIKFLSNRLYFDEEVKELARLVCISETLDSYEKYMFLALLRRAMIRKLPYSRMNVPWKQIVKLRDEDYSYMKYKRRRAYHNLSFKQHILENIDNYNNAVFDNGKRNISYNMDAFEMLKKLKEPVDIIYLDPPYPKTMNKYGEFYGLFDQVFGKEKEYIDFSANDMFMQNIENLIQKCINKTKYIVISLNNKTSPSADELKIMLEKYGNVSIKYRDFQYKVTGKENKNTTIEILIIVKIKNEIQ